MKEKIIVLAAIVTIAVIGASAYHGYSVEKNHIDATRAAQAKSLQQKQNQLEQDLIDRANEAVAQCNKAADTIKTYNKLTTTKVDLAEPTCPQAIIQ